MKTVPMLKAFAGDRRGAVAITSALLMTALIGFAALGVDVGSIYTDRRKAQSVADLAALAAVANLTNADRAAAATLASNKLMNASYSLQYGVYTADPALAPENRFAPSSAAAANAARVVLNTSTPLFFARVVTGKDTFAISSTATAAQSSFVNFAIGSRLLQVDGGLLNSVLGSLLGTTLSLSAMDYNALLSAKLDAFGFVNALATRLQITSGTYGSLLSSNVRIGDIVAAMIDTAKGQYGGLSPAVSALTSVQQSIQGIATKVGVRAMIDLGPYDSMAVGTRPQASAGLAAYDMLTAMAQMANGDSQAAVALKVAVPGIVSATLKLKIGERPQGTSWVTFGSTGATVHTAQTRLLLTVQLAGTGSYSLVSVPIYIEIASGTATLSAISCGIPDISTSTATLSVRPGLIDAWIGQVSSGDFNNISRAVDPDPATLINVAGLRVTAFSHVSVSNISTTPVTFSYSDIQNQTKKTVGTTSYASSLVSSLVGSSHIGVDAFGFGMNAPLISSGVRNVLTTATSPIDQLLASLLQTLGVGLGQADVWMSGIRCDGGVLVL
jgi:uncharacterized membrane protein